MGIEAAAIPEFDRFDQGSQLQHLDPIVGHGREHVLEPGLETEPVGHHQVGLCEQARLLGRGGEVVGIDTDWDQHLHISFVTDHSAGDVAQDRSGCHDDQTLLNLF